MPGASGLDVAASLGQPRPLMIFCTAFDQYAGRCLRAVRHRLPVEAGEPRPAGSGARARPADAAGARSGTRARCRRRDAGPDPTRFLARRGARFRVVHAPTSSPSPSTRASRACSRRPSSSRCSRRSRRWPGGWTRRTSSRSREPQSSASTPSAKRNRFRMAPARSLLANGQTVPVARRRWRLR